MEIERNPIPHRLLCHLKIQALVFAASLFLSLPTGCTPNPIPTLSQFPTATLAASGYDFIRDGVSLRADIMARLGAPIYQFENQRIFIYRCRRQKERITLLNAEQFEPSRNWKDQRNPRTDLGSLVLVFDENGLLQKHSLVLSQ